MLNDDNDPTLPDLCDAPTLLEMRPLKHAVKREPPPAWPLPAQRVQHPQPPRHDPPSHRWLNATALGATLILLLSLFSLLVLLSLTSGTGILSFGRSISQIGPGSATATATATGDI